MNCVYLFFIFYNLLFKTLKIKNGGKSEVHIVKRNEVDFHLVTAWAVSKSTEFGRRLRDSHSTELMNNVRFPLFN